MDNWIKIETFERLHQAELRKEILESNDMPAVIINERDSLFLMGDIELYVRTEDEKKAKALIDDFTGLTKINSFIDLKPIKRLYDILADADIHTIIKRKEDARFIKDNFELYVRNPDLDDVIPYLSGEKLTGWSKLMTCRKVRQTKFYVDLLDEHLINTITIKKKDSDYHLEEVYIYVQLENFAKASTILDLMTGWEIIRHSELYSGIEVLEVSLSEHGIKSFIKREDEKFSLLVAESDVARAEEILNLEAEWITVVELPSVVEAQYYQQMLENQSIQTVIVNEQDSTFLLGNVELAVEVHNRDKALELINEMRSLEE